MKATRLQRAALESLDYRALLVKYMAEVLSCEGISFIGSALPEIAYTDEERAELEKIEAEAHALL
jgi:hypothetical protein